MANYTSQVRTLRGRPGSSVDSLGDVSIRLTANEGFRFAEPHGFSIIDTQDIFDEETIVRISDTELSIVISVRDDISIPNVDTDVPIRITGETIPDENGVDVILDNGDGDPVDSDGDGTDDSDLDFEDEDGNPVEDIVVDEDGEEGDMTPVGSALLCPIPSRRFREDANGNIILPSLPSARNLGNGAMLIYSYPMNEDGTVDLERAITERGCVRFLLTVRIGSGNSDGNEGGGEGGDLSDDFDDIFEDGGGGGSEEIPDDDVNRDEPIIFNVDVNADNVDPIQGGFIIVTATGTEGATGMITITPMVVGPGRLPDSVRPIPVSLRIPASGVDVQTIRIPSLAGDENLNPLCMPDLPDGVDGAEWVVDSDDDDLPIEGDVVIRQDNGGQVCFLVNSSDTTIPTGEGSQIIDMGWRHTTLLEGIRGGVYPNGIWRVVVPNGGGQWTLLDANNGVVDINPDTDITCDAGLDPGFCDGTATIDADGNLVISQPYSGGTFPIEKRTCSISLDNLATLSAEIRVTFDIPDSAPFSISPRSQSEFSYAGTPGMPVVAGTEPTQVVLIANEGHTWRHIDPTAVVNLMAGAMNSVNNHVTNIRIDPTIASLQQAGGDITELVVLWDLQGSYRMTGPTDTYTLSLANGVPRRVVTNMFNTGANGRGVNQGLANSRFIDIDDVTGTETRSWSTRYIVRADDGSVFRRNTNVVVTATSTFPVTVSTPTPVGTDEFPTEFEGTISGTFGASGDTISLNGTAASVRQVQVQFSKTNNVVGTTARAGFIGTINSVEGDVVTRQLFLDVTDSGSGFTQIPTIETPGSVSNTTPVFAGTPVVVDGVSYYPSISTTVSKVLTAEPIQSIATICTGGAVRAIPATFTKVVVETSPGIVSVPDVVTIIGDSDGDRRIDDETASVSFSVRTEEGFAWRENSLENGDFTLTHGPNISNIFSTFSRIPSSDTAMNGDISIDVTGIYTVPAGTAGGSALREVLTVGGNGPAGLASITANPSSLTFEAADNNNAGNQQVAVTLTSGAASTDTITHTSPAGFTVTAPSNVNEGTRTFTIRPSAENESLTNSITGTVIFGSSLIPSVTTEVTLTQNPALPRLNVTPSQVNIGNTAGSTGTFMITSNTTWTISGLSSDFTLSSSSGTGDATITVTSVNANTNITDVTDTITITSGTGNLVRNIVLNQAGATRTITLDGENAGSDGMQTVDPIGNTGGMGTLNVVSNDPGLTWTAEEVTDDDGIVSGLRTSGGAGDPVTYLVDSNGMSEPAKTATIRVVFRSGGAIVSTRTITIQLAAGEPAATQESLRMMFPNDLWVFVGGENTFNPTTLESVDGEMIAGRTGDFRFPGSIVGTTYAFPPDKPNSWTMRRLVTSAGLVLGSFSGGTVGRQPGYATEAPLQRGEITNPTAIEAGVNFQIGSDAIGDYQLGGRDVSSALYTENFIPTRNAWFPPSPPLSTALSFRSSPSGGESANISGSVNARLVTPGTVNAVIGLRGSGVTNGADLPSGTYSTHRGLGSPTYSEMIDGNNVQFPFGADPILFRVEADDHWAMEIDGAGNIETIVADGIPFAESNGNFFASITPNGDWTDGIQLVGGWNRWIFYGTRTFAVSRNSVRAGARTPTMRIRPVTGSETAAGLATGVTTTGPAFRTYSFRGPRGL